jgi:oxygen-independent coproporphyrinogen-3 oxidase
MAVDLPQICRLYGRDPKSAIINPARIESLVADGAVTMINDLLSVRDSAEFLVRSVASAFADGQGKPRLTYINGRDARSGEKV